jgi:hypothetical protein
MDVFRGHQCTGGPPRSVPWLPSQEPIPPEGFCPPWPGCVHVRRAGRSRRGARSDPSRLFLHEYWDWVAVALFLLVGVDLLTTLAAARVVGPGSEANPLMRCLLGWSVLVVVALHLLVVVLATGFFRLLVDLLRRTDPPRDRVLARLVEAWIGVLVAVGLGVFANNLAVVVLGESLL